MNNDQAATPLPTGRHFAVTWSLPVEHGGRTNAMLHRSWALAQEGNVSVDILTFDSFRDYPSIRAALTEEGRLSTRLRIRNIWEELSAMAASPMSPPQDDLAGFTPLTKWEGLSPVESDGPHKRLLRYATDGSTVLQTDYLRPDGSLLLSDRSDVEDVGELGGRLLTLCNADGVPVATWGSMWGLYRTWLDYLTGGEPSYFIVDNKHAGSFMKTYSRPDAVVMYVIHDSHLAIAADGPTSPLTPAARVLFPRMDSYDGVVILTEAQADDVRARIGDIGNFYVIPNSRSKAMPSVPLPRNPNSGVLLAQLTPRKRIDHAIKAINKVSDIHALSVGLDIYGEGQERSNLERLILDLDCSTCVKLQGHVPSAKDAFERASFSLLTSTSEGLPLVIVESMAAGCIPILYDIHYGPASVVTHGVNGFVVEYGNVDALADCIAHVLSLPEEEVSAIRAAAVKRAQDYSDEAVVAQWNLAFRDAVARKELPRPNVRTDVVGSACAVWTDGTLRIETEVRLEDPEAAVSAAPRFYCRMNQRDEETFFRVQAEGQELTDDGAFLVNFKFQADVISSLRDCVMDVFLETLVEGTRVSTRIPLSQALGAMEPYATVLGNMSLRVS